MESLHTFLDAHFFWHSYFEYLLKVTETIYFFHWQNLNFSNCVNPDTIRSSLLTKIRHFSYSHHVWPVLKCLSKEWICNTKNDTRPEIYDTLVRPYLQFPWHCLNTMPGLTGQVLTVVAFEAIIFGCKVMLFSKWLLGSCPCYAQVI